MSKDRKTGTKDGREKNELRSKNGRTFLRIKNCTTQSFHCPHVQAISCSENALY